jgi:hypothetical protein
MNREEWAVAITMFVLAAAVLIQWAVVISKILK